MRPTFFSAGIERVEICGLLGYYTATCGNCSPTLRDNYHTTPHNTPEDRRSHQHRGRSLKSRLNMCCIIELDVLIGALLYNTVSIHTTQH